MIDKVANYATLVFDCDGVVLDSNKVKSKAFYQATLPYGEAAAQEMLHYHIANGGVSRYKKFAHFLEQIVPNHAPSLKGPSLEELLQVYADYVREGLLNCDIAQGLAALRKQTPRANWLIVSGGDQAELRDVFSQRGIDKVFDGIFGSPDTKEDILIREIENKNLRFPALFLGDSKYDYRAASSQKLDFLFLSNWTEVLDWKKWSHLNEVPTADSIQSVVEMG